LASIEASDIVIANDDIQKVPQAIKISRYTRKIVWQNIIFSALVKIVFLTLGAAGITGMLSAVIADVGVTVLAIINSLRALNHKTKHTNKLHYEHKQDGEVCLHNHSHNCNCHNHNEDNNKSGSGHHDDNKYDKEHHNHEGLNCKNIDFVNGQKMTNQNLDKHDEHCCCNHHKDH
jgi:hypothetical protein